MNLATRPASLILAVLLAAPWAAPAAEPGGCTGTLSGAVTARFACTVTTRVEGTQATLVVAVDGAVNGVRALQPGTVSLAVPLASGTYSGAALLRASSSLESASGTRYDAGAGRGEVTLTVDQAERYRQAPNHLVVSGSLKARLVPAQAGPGEVVVEVRF